MYNIAIFGQFRWSWWKYTDFPTASHNIFRRMLREAKRSGHKEVFMIMRDDNDSIHYGYIIKIGFKQYIGIGTSGHYLIENGIGDIMLGLRKSIAFLAKIRCIIKGKKNDAFTPTGESFAKRITDLRMFLSNPHIGSEKKIPIPAINCSIGKDEIIRRKYANIHDPSTKEWISSFTQKWLNRGYPNFLYELSTGSAKNSGSSQRSYQQKRRRDFKPVWIICGIIGIIICAIYIILECKPEWFTLQQEQILKQIFFWA